MQQPGIEQHLHQWLDPADLNQFRHRVPACRTHVGEHRYARADAAEVLELEGHPSGVGDRQQVQDRVGRALQRNGDGHGVFERLTAEDVGRTDAALQQVAHRGARSVGVGTLVVGDRVLR